MPAPTLWRFNRTPATLPAPAVPQNTTRFRLPPIYAVAWIDPRQTNQQGQEAQVARFPMATINQRNQASATPAANDFTWKTAIRTANPSQWWLIYQMLTEETTVQGMGHDILRSLGDTAWVRDTNGIPITFPRPDKNNEPYRIYDQRSKAFQAAQIEALGAIFRQHEQFGGAQGIFFDQCFIHSAITDTGVRAEMLAAMQANFQAFRFYFPDKIFVTNGSARFPGCNGGCDEDPFAKGRPLNSPASFSGQELPRCEIVQCYHSTVIGNEAAIRAEFNQVRAAGSSYGVGNGGQFPLWLDGDFDDALAAWQAGA